MAQPAPTPTDTPAPSYRRPKFWVRLVAFVATLFTAWHLLASFLWIAPYSANAREIVPGDTLTSYMLPFFGQSWSVFAPEPINGDYHFNVRATITNANGDEIETGWVSATDVELSMIRYNLFPPRAGIQSSEVASGYKRAFDRLTDTQRHVVTGDFTVDEWEVGLRAALEAQPDSNEARVEALAKAERLATAYATQVARSIWGDAVVQVQFRVSRQDIIPFAQRHNPDAQRPAPQIVLPGWRAPIVQEGQNDGNFSSVFKNQYDRITR